MTAEALISKAIDDNRLTVFDRYEIGPDYFQTEPEREAFSFIQRYSAENGGSSPSYAVLVEAVPDFTYIPGVTDSYEYLARKLKEAWGKRKLAEFLGGPEVASRFAEIGKSATIDEYERWLTTEIAEIKRKSTVRRETGIDVTGNEAADVFLAEYEARASGKSRRLWKSKFPTINAAVGGGYWSSNMYVVFARSGRGKSVLTMEEAIEFAFQGATVLVWALEMGGFEWMARAYTSISARLSLVSATVDGIDYGAGFDNRALQGANLSSENYESFVKFLREINEMIPGKLIVRATDDDGFIDRSLAALRSDIIETGADVVIVDPFYYLDYETNTSKTAGGDAAATSKKLRIMTGNLGVVTIAITQADEDAGEKSDEGVRELRSPRRADVKKTKQLLEDAALLVGLDTLAHEGRGVIELGKGRSGGEDTRAEIVYLPNIGIVREPVAADVAAKFVGNF
ncbi:DnaB-like helicase C-terminal domain-containing protein [Paenibacillus sp. CAU 1782]